MKTRRDFLRLSTAGALLPSVDVFSSIPSAGSPIVISTWNFGLAANVEAWKILSRNGRALDAVEAGARVPEGDPNETSVGLGGLPDREGKVTLDACIMDEKGNCGSVAFVQGIVHPNFCSARSNGKNTACDAGGRRCAGVRVCQRF